MKQGCRVNTSKAAPPRRVYLIEMPDSYGVGVFLTKKAARAEIQEQRRWFGSWSQARIVAYVPEAPRTGSRK